MLRVKCQTDLPAFRTRRLAAGEAGKMLVPLLGVLSVLAIGVAAAAIVLGMKEREQRQAKERELRQALIENEDLQSHLKDIQQAKAKMEGELARVHKELTQSQEDLAKAAEEKTTLAKSIEDREKEIDRLAKELAHSKDDAKGISSQLSQLQSERDAMKQQVAELQSKVMDLSSASRPTVELDKVLVKDEAGQVREASATSGSSKPTADGQVVVVNREYDFIVMNIGKNHGLSVGQEFQIIRDNQVLGRVKVDKVYDELSAAAILPESQKDNIREGDNVRAL